MEDNTQQVEKDAVFVERMQGASSRALATSSSSRRHSR